MTDEPIPPGQYDVVFVDQTVTHWKCKIVKGEHEGKCFWLKKDHFMIESSITHYHNSLQ